MYKDKKVSAIIAAAGLSSRMKTRVNKQFLNIDSKPVLAHTLEAFNDSSLIDEIILVTQEIELENCQKNIVAEYAIDKVKKIIVGGRSREESVYNGLKEVSDDTELVVSHDGARPFIEVDLIEKSIREAYKTGACIVGVPVKDTIKFVDQGKVEETPDRDRLWAIQTPQTFKKQVLFTAYEKAFNKGLRVTDDSSLVELLGMEISVIMGDYRNIKITTLEDMDIAESIIASRKRGIG